jgi:hypothetical protein
MRLREARRCRMLEDLTFIVGQVAFKEYMARLWRRWTESLEHIDREEQLSSSSAKDALTSLKRPLLAPCWR